MKKTSTFASYFGNIRFDNKLYDSFHAKYITNFRLVLLLIISIVILGMFSYVSIPRRLNPEVDIPIIVVNTLLPGASPKDVESLITIPLEDKLLGIAGVDTITSASRENVSSIVLQFLSTVETEKAKQDVQSLVDTVSDLPEDAKDPVVAAVDFEREPIWNFVVTTEKDKASLMRFSKALKEKIEDSTKVDDVQVSGLDTAHIEVVVRPEKINQYGINPFALSQLVAKSAQSYPAGTFETSTSSFAFSIDSDITSVDAIRNIRVQTKSGESFALSDIADVYEKAESGKGRTLIAKKTGALNPAVQFFIFKTKSSNIDAADKEVKAIVEKEMAAYDDQFDIITVVSSAEEIVEQFSDLLGEFQSTILLVFINLFIFLGLRQAIIASFTFPLTFLTSIAVLNNLGMSLNFLTLFAFLLSLGLLIDDTIVTVAAMTRYHATGKFTPTQTGLLVWRDFIVPLWSTTITTIWAFVPLLLSTGIIGEFIKPIPIVVTTTMLASTSIAVLITIPLMIVIFDLKMPRRVRSFLSVAAFVAVVLVCIVLAPQSSLKPIFVIIELLLVFILFRNRKKIVDRYKMFSKSNPKVKRVSTKIVSAVNHGIVDIEKISAVYMQIIDRILKSAKAPKMTIFVIIIFAAAAYLLVPTGLVQTEFFPKTGQNILYVTVDMPSGTNLSTSEPEAVAVAKKIQTIPAVEIVTVETATELSADFSRSSNPASFLITVNLPEDDKKNTSLEMAEVLREKFKNYNKGTLAVRELSGGPPAGADIQIKLLGDDPLILDQYANIIADFLKKQQGIATVDKSVKPGTSKLVFVPDKAKLAQHDVSVDTIGIWMRTYISGFTLDTVKIHDEERNIIFKTKTSTLQPEEIASIYIPTQNGPVSLLSLGLLKLENNPTTVTRENGKRTVSVFAAVAKGVSVAEKNKQLETYANTLSLPAGYSWATGGVNEENQKSVQSILQAMILSFILILITMVIEFGSYRQAVITLLVIPLAIPGVFYIFGLTGIPLSFPALIGILALFGIVVTNAIVVVEKINENRRHGMPLREAIVHASGSRLEPIMLTSLTSILGLVPITIADPLWRGLGGAIIAGLLFSGIIKLFFVPIAYYLWYKNDEDSN